MEVASPKRSSFRKDTTKSSIVDNLPLGCTISSNGIVFRLFSPLADQVFLVVFDSYEHTLGTYYSMKRDEHGRWNYIHSELNLIGKWYAYKIIGDEESPRFEGTHKYIADPWSKHVTSRNHYLGFHKTLITECSKFEWEDEHFQGVSDPRDLIIYEAHIKDMVAHPSAKTYVQGIYNDFWQAEVGGLSHLKNLGVNCVEFLPLQKFAYWEPPFDATISNGLRNSWNTYARNHWGYMTSFFLSPETIYASDGNINHGSVIGRKTNASSELKNVVNKLHQENITVLMDVVYNHASQYDLNPLRFTAKDHYFRIDEKGNYINDSWTGNDINTANEYSRALIIESVKHWMTEYHIDGFRFDLAGIIDWETIDRIRTEAEKINPKVILIAEPWGGEYKPSGFSNHGWSSWNDKFRNGFKGYHPVNNNGLLFGAWHEGCNRHSVENFIRGTLLTGDHGLFSSSKHSVNYIESHDGYTFADFIKIALDHSRIDKIYKSLSEANTLGKKELAIAKLGALVLFVSQGISMIHQGQEWGRSKVIIDHKGMDPNAGKLDHDSYNKDNETNWLNFNEIQQNKELFEYYKALIQLRLKSPALRKAEPSDIVFKVYNDPLHITFSIHGKNSGDRYNYFISLNGNMNIAHDIELPEGNWEMIANERKCDLENIEIIANNYQVLASSGVILRQLR